MSVYVVTLYFPALFTIHDLIDGNIYTPNPNPAATHTTLHHVVPSNSITAQTPALRFRNRSRTVLYDHAIDIPPVPISTGTISHDK